MATEEPEIIDRVHSINVGNDDCDIAARISANGLVRYFVQSDKADPVEVSRDDAIAIAAILGARCMDNCVHRLDQIDDMITEMAGRR